VNNGGLTQFFGNSSGNHVVDTLKALAELPHHEAHAALDAAMRLVGPLAREENREARLVGFDGRWDELSTAFDQLEHRYWESQLPLRVAILLYVASHASHFQS